MHAPRADPRARAILSPNHRNNMKNITAITLTALFATASLHAAEPKKDGPEIAETDVVESGTYKGVAHEVDPEEKEIYVKTADGKMIELYLKSDTAITKDGKKVGFGALKKGQNLEVKVEKNGEKLKPISVTILD